MNVPIENLDEYISKYGIKDISNADFEENVCVFTFNNNDFISMTVDDLFHQEIVFNLSKESSSLLDKALFDLYPEEYL